MLDKLKKYLHNVLVGADQEANIITGGAPDDTISSRSYRAAQRGNRFGRFMNWWLGKIQKNHGALANEGDKQRAEEELKRTEDHDAT